MKKVEYIGPYIHYIRQCKGIHASDVCMHTKISSLELENIENGKLEAHPNTIKRICDYIQIDFINLFKNQEKYQCLLDDFFNVLAYGILDEQEILMKKIDKISYEESILFPEFVLAKLMYIGVHDFVVDEFRPYLEKLEDFIHVLNSDCKGLYYIYKGVYYRKRNELSDAISCFRLADEGTLFTYRELLYHHLGVLYYLLDDDLTSLTYYGKAYELYEKKWNINRLLYTKASMAFSYVSMRHYDVAEKQILQTLRLAKRYKNDGVICSCYDNLSYNCLLMRNYEMCIHYGLLAIKAGSTSSYLCFFLAYSYAELQQYGDAALWAGKRDQMNVESLEYMLLIYVKKLIDQTDDAIYLEALYQRLGGYDLKEMRLFMLENLAEIYHEQCNYIEENRIQKNIIALLK